jgi:hypothetical protein
VEKAVEILWKSCGRLRKKTLIEAMSESSLQELSMLIPLYLTWPEYERPRLERCYYMKLTLSQTVLRRLLSVYLTHREQLTEHEQALAARVCSCTLCEHLWVRRIKKVPTRCPNCARTSWNRPLLELIKAQDNAAAAERKEPAQ